MSLIAYCPIFPTFDNGGIPSFFFYILEHGHGMYLYQSKLLLKCT